MAASSTKFARSDHVHPPQNPQGLVVAKFKNVLRGDTFPPGVWLDWNDPEASVSFGTSFDEGMGISSIRFQLSRYSGNGDCRNRTELWGQMGDDVEELLCKDGKICLEKFTPYAAAEMRTRWDERELMWRFKLAIADTRVPYERAKELLHSAMVKLVMET